MGGFIKYLITGGAGFIGSNLVNYLIDSSEKIIVVDNLITGNLENLENYKNNTKFEFYSHDIQNHFEINENIDYVIHLASCASPFAYSNYPINTLKSGSIGTINALGLAKKHDESKRFAESATQAYITSHGLKANIARIFNTYGPNMVFNDGRVVTNFIYQAINDKDITIYGDGTQTRSFSYIDDTINGIVKILNYKSPDVFNIGNDEEVTIKDLAKKIILLTGSKSKIKFLDLPQDDPKQRKPDLSKAEKLLDYTPSITLDEGLKKTIEWFLERYK